MRFITGAYLSSYALSLLGNSIAGVALPLIVLQATGSALGAGTVAAATAVPAVIAGLLMGVVIDRINRRTSSVVTDLISAAAVAALPIVDAITGLSLGWFILFGIIGAVGDVPGMTAREALLPAVLRRSGDSAERIVGIREGVAGVTILIGPAIAGTLMVLFEGSTVLWITAATSLLAALVTLLIPHETGVIVADERAPLAAGSVWRQLHEGWLSLLRNRLLLSLTVIGLASIAVLGSLQGLVLPLYFTVIGEPGLFGFVLSALALGTLVGAAVYAVLATRLGRRAWLLLSAAGITGGIALMAALPSPWLVFAGAFLVGLFSGLINSLVGVLTIERIPEALRGRILSTQNALMMVAAPAAILLAGAVAEFAGVGVAAWVVASLWVVALVVILAARSLRTLDSDAPGEEERSADAQR
jgi:MFS family permease